MPFCNHCGNEYSITQGKCLKCGAILPSLPKESYNSEVKEFPYPKAQRVVSGIIDLSVVFIIFLLLFLTRRVVITLILRRGLAILIPHLYLLLKDSFEGKSIGKIFVGIIVYNEKENKAGGILDSIIRNWYLAIPIIGPTIFVLIIGIQILLGNDKRIGDKEAGTIIITDEDYQRIT